MFGANIEKKVIPEGKGFEVYTNITMEVLDHVNKTQYYVPSLSFIFVLYTYCVIGEGKLWKHLLHVTFYGFVAVTLTSIFDALRPYVTLDYVLQIKWLEAIFWHLNEYGYVYISYIKLQTVVTALKKKYWEYIMKILFVYNLIVRFVIAAATVVGRTSMAGSHLQGLTFLPLALVEVAFMYLIIKTFIDYSNNGLNKNVVSTLLTSSLTRMFLVGLIYFITSIVCFMYSPAILKSIKNAVWRAKAALGLIFLLDLLFIRIDLREKLGYNNVIESSGHKKEKRKKKTSEKDKYILYNAHTGDFQVTDPLGEGGIGLVSDEGIGDFSDEEVEEEDHEDVGLYQNPLVIKLDNTNNLSNFEDISYRHYNKSSKNSDKYIKVI